MAGSFFLHYYSLLMVWENIRTKGNNSRCMSFYSVRVYMYILYVQWMGGHRRTLSVIASAVSATEFSYCFLAVRSSYSSSLDYRTCQTIAEMTI